MKGDMRKNVSKGKELEEEIAKLARAKGWTVKERKKHGKRIQDLILKKGKVVLVVQLKNTKTAGPKDVSQARRDYFEFIDHLLREELGVRVGVVLISNDFSESAKKRARSYGIMLYKVEEFKKLLDEG